MTTAFNTEQLLSLRWRSLRGKEGSVLGITLLVVLVVVAWGLPRSSKGGCSSRGLGMVVVIQTPREWKWWWWMMSNLPRLAGFRMVVERRSVDMGRPGRNSED